jgi:hypothetical protein
LVLFGVGSGFCDQVRVRNPADALAAALTNLMDDLFPSDLTSGELKTKADF